MVCNKTNANRIAYYYGDDLDNWRQKSIILGAELVDYQGKVTEAIRAKGRAGPVGTETPAAPATPAPAATEKPFDDEIPF